MYDQSFNPLTLARALRPADFWDQPKLKLEGYRRRLIAAALKSANLEFGGRNPLSRFLLDGRKVYRARYLRDDLVLRRLCSNLRHIARASPQSRNFIVANLKQLVSEGVPFRIYRLDIRNFYESFNAQAVSDAVDALTRLSPTSKRLIRALLANFGKARRSGIPRGLALSAALSEFMMKDFDSTVSMIAGVYYYGRYVDDIAIITRGDEDQTLFLRKLQQILPKNLTLHENKRVVHTASSKVSPAKGGKSSLFSFDYLGYRFHIAEPIAVPGEKAGKSFRDVEIDISDSKVKKIKTRLVRSFIAFNRNGDFALLHSRIKFLTSNFSVREFAGDRHKLSGIYFSYPYVDATDAPALDRLDKFLRSLALSTRGRLFSGAAHTLSQKQRRRLLGFSFKRGHKRRHFVYFSPRQLIQIQKCWLYE